MKKLNIFLILLFFLIFTSTSNSQLSVTHSYHSDKPDPVDTSIIGASKWNANHTISGTLPVENLPDLSSLYLPTSTNYFNKTSDDTDDITVGTVNKFADTTKENNGQTAYGWGNHASAGYLTTYTETDPVVKALNGIIKSNGSAISTCSNLTDTAYATTSTKLDDFGTPDDNTDLNANTTNHGLLLKATAPAAGLYNYVGITNGETAYTNKALFDATVPSTQALGDSAATGSATVSSRRDHKHAMPATTDLFDNTAGGTDALTTKGATSNIVYDHGIATTGIHGVGAGTIAKTSDITATKLDDFTATDNNTDLNATTSAHGLCPKGDSTATHFLNGNLGWSTPAGGTGATVIDADVTYTVKTSGGDFTDIQEALDSLLNVVIPSGVIVTIEVDDGLWEPAEFTPSKYTWPVTLDFTNCNIKIKGKTSLENTLTSIQSSSGSAGAYSIVINMDTVAGMAVDDYITIPNATGGTNPERIVGCHKITNVDAVNTRLTITSINTTGVPSGAVIGVTYVEKTQIKFPHTTVGIENTTGVCYLEHLTLIGADTNTQELVETLWSSTTFIEQVGFVGEAGTSGNCPGWNGTIVLKVCGISNTCGIWAYSNGSLIQYGNVGICGGEYGIYAETNSHYIKYSGTLLISGQGSAETIPEPNTLGNQNSYIGIGEDEGIPVAYQAFKVGGIYINTTGTNPATELGYGTWSAFGAGKVLVGLDSGDANFDTSEETGGAKTVQSSAQTFAGTPSSVIVNHTHTMPLRGASTGSVTTVASGLTAGSDTSSTNVGSTSNPDSGGAANYTPAGTNTPGSATSVVQPYIVVYFWKRTA